MYSSPSACKETEANIQREIDILHTLKRGNCVNVVKMFDFGWDSCGTAATIVMEFVEYGSLVEYLEWSGKKIQVGYILLALCGCTQVLWCYRTHFS